MVIVVTTLMGCWQIAELISPWAMHVLLLSDTQLAVSLEYIQSSYVYGIGMLVDSRVDVQNLHRRDAQRSKLNDWLLERRASAKPGGN